MAKGAGKGPFAGSDGLLNKASFWRGARPGLILIAAVLIGAMATTAHQRIVVVAVGAGVVVVLVAVAALGRRGIERRPARVVWVAEVEVVAFVCTVVLVLAVAVNVVAWLTDRYQQRGPAYLIGLVAGAAVGYFSRDLLGSVADENWFAAHFRSVMAALYKPYFYRRNPVDRAYVGDDLMARWLPDGLAADALRMNQYRTERGDYVSGWTHANRVRRAATIKGELSRQPWRPDPNGELAPAIPG